MATASAPAGYVDGRRTGSGPLLAVHTPATGHVAAHVATNTPDEFRTAVAAARRAFDTGGWPHLPVRERTAVLARMASHLEARRGELVETVITETGCPRFVTEPAQVDLPLALARDLPALLERLPDWEHNEMPLGDYVAGPGKLRLSVRKFVPVGVVSAVPACNFPLMLAVVKAFPALATGCTVVLRPSPLAPLSALVLADAAEDAGLPPGVLNVLVEEGIEGAELMTTHPDVDLVTFTGSTAVGRTIGARAGGGLKRLVLELGGKSVQLYLPDALASGPGRAVAGALGVFVNHAGQACVAQSRMLVPRAHEQQVLDALAAAADALTVGDPRDPSVRVGPLVNRAARDRCLSYVDAAVAAGARVVAGGAVPESPSEGWYFRPTVLSVDSNGNPACRDEIFGPVLTVQAYDTVDEAVGIANDTRYGLSGAVYTDDYAAGLAIADRIRAGNVHVNTGCATAYTPSGGMGLSGIGRERGVAGLRAFQEIKHVVVGNA